MNAGEEGAFWTCNSTCLATGVFLMPLQRSAFEATPVDEDWCAPSDKGQSH